MLRKHLPTRAKAHLYSLVALLIFCGNRTDGQTFSSRSNGSDGALNLTTPGTFEGLKTVNSALDPDGDNVYHFTTINIAAGVTVKFSSKNHSGPIYLLAQGPVTINGILDLSGENGHVSSSLASLRVPAAGGAGGYSGGVGGATNVFPPPQNGNGPGGAIAPTGCCSPGGAGTFTGSQYLIPLIGGSGGSGGIRNDGLFGAGGGAGGGSILIASSVSITLGGRILARGGNSGGGGGTGGIGSGGAVRLIAPTLSNATSGSTDCIVFGIPNGRIDVQGASGNNGVIRLEASNPITINTLDCVRPAPITSAPFNPALPPTPPSAIKVTSLVVNGVTVPIDTNPFSFPDATISAPGPVTVNVQAQFIPIGTTPKIIVMSETGPDQTVNCSAPLAGTLQLSMCSAQVTFPTGGSRGFVKATWQ